MFAKKPKGATEKSSSSLSGLLWMLLGAILTLMIGVFLYLSPLFDFNTSGRPADNAEREVQPRVQTDTDNGNYEFYDILPNQEMATIPEATVVEPDGDRRPSDETDFRADVVIDRPVEPQVADSNTANMGVDKGLSTANNPAAQLSTPTGDAEIVVVEENETYEGNSVPAPSTTEAEKKRNQSSSTSSNAKPAKAQISAATPRSSYILQINSYSSADEADRRRAQVLMAGVDAKVVKNVTGNNQTIYQVISQPMTSRQAVAQAQQRLQNNGIDSLIVEQRRQ